MSACKTFNTVSVSIYSLLVKMLRLLSLVTIFLYRWWFLTAAAETVADIVAGAC